MSANTPVTWRYERETEFNCSAIIASNGNIICEFADEPEEQYAELIAAAPELLEAIEGLLNALPSATAHPAIKSARAAITKAKGGAA